MQRIGKQNQCSLKMVQPGQANTIREPTLFWKPVFNTAASKYNNTLQEDNNQKI